MNVFAVACFGDRLFEPILKYNHSMAEKDDAHGRVSSCYPKNINWLISPLGGLMKA